MGTNVTSSSGSVLEEPEIQKLQMQAKIFKENSLNKLNALKSTTQLLERQTFSADQASVFMAKTFERRLVLHQMTSDHNRSELGIHDHNNEPSSSVKKH
ncbi:hypothetical protein Tco_0768095 [Tanacetum coccineum]